VGLLSPRPALLPSFFPPKKFNKRTSFRATSVGSFLTWPRRQLVTLLRELECSVRKTLRHSAPMLPHRRRPASGPATLVVDFAVGRRRSRIARRLVELLRLPRELESLWGALSSTVSPSFSIALVIHPSSKSSEAWMRFGWRGAPILDPRKIHACGTLNQVPDAFLCRQPSPALRVRGR